MTYPTKAMLPLMLEDFHKVMASRGGGDGANNNNNNNNENSNNGELSFSRADIDAAARAAVAVPLHATVPIAGGRLTLRAFYAGHVLGAAMFEVRVADGGASIGGRKICGAGTQKTAATPPFLRVAVDGASVLYSGDYNMTPDRHLGPARPLRTRPDVFITESTYATTVRGPKRTREREFLDAVVAAVSAPRSGKVLVPVFALGRAQELMCLVEDHWTKLGLWDTVPVLYSAGMVPRANAYYRLLTGWAAERVRARAAAGGGGGGGSESGFGGGGGETSDRPFEFSRMRPFRRGVDADVPGPCVLFATPGMLHGGQSLEVFKAWAPDPRNLIVLPGYCVSGTVGAKLIAAAASVPSVPSSSSIAGGIMKNKRHHHHHHRRVVEVDRRGTCVDVRCQVAYLSFSAHADAAGIADAVRAVAPGAVVLVHGEASKMNFLKNKLESTFGVPVLMPANGCEVEVERAGGGGAFGVGTKGGRGAGGVGGGGGAGGDRRRQRIFGAVASPSVAAAVVGGRGGSGDKKKKNDNNKEKDDAVAEAGAAVDAGWRPSPAHSALVELVLRERRERGGGFGVGLATGDGDGDENDYDYDYDDREDGEAEGDEKEEGDGKKEMMT